MFVGVSEVIGSRWSMAAPTDLCDGLQQPPGMMQSMQSSSGGGQAGVGAPAYFDQQQHAQYNMGPHSAPPMPKQHMPFTYPVSVPSTSGQAVAPPSYYSPAGAGRPPPLNRTVSGQPRVQQIMGPPVPRKQLICVFSSELGNK